MSATFHDPSRPAMGAPATPGPNPLAGDPLELGRADGYRVLIVDDEDTIRFILRELLEREGCIVDEAENGVEALNMARRNGYDLYLLDMKMPEMDGLAALRQIRRIYPDALAVMITAFGSNQLALDCLKAGAYDYFTKPFNIEELRILLLRALEKQRLLRRIRELEDHLPTAPFIENLIGESEVMQQLGANLKRLAEHDVTVLITGESGTGKELVARAIHRYSARRSGPFVTVNCAAIPEPLLESELFGHEKGAFTGATAARAGRFEAAAGGTILLDEIGEMPLALQAKLLRVLQQHEVERVGSNRPRPIDIRVIAATHRDLAAMVREGTFREDLYFRINVVPLHLPPLRERRDDIAPLVRHFINEFNVRFGKRIEGVAPEALALLEAHAWQGNVRELENVIQRAMVMSAGNVINPAALPPGLGANGATAAPEPAGNPGDPPPELPDRPLTEYVEEIVEREERRLIEAALRKTGGRRQETADLLGIARKSLHNKMKRYGMLDQDEE
ncbi:MAG: Transcriptional regulatory protein ZraR [candidate division BRC1 bacterium ADurb.BinA292]|nr:MAG: Transcriptional regulatory protein ZraR [candidate division BRC1 bacterium ADurb.BinA292]